MWKSDVSDDQFLPVRGGNVCPWTFISRISLNAAVCVYLFARGSYCHAGPDAIAMDLADEGKTGTFLGKYRGYATMGSMAASLLVFIGFRYRGVLVPGGQIDRSVVLRVTCSRCGGVILPVETEKRLRPLMCESMMRKKGLPLKKKYIPYYIVTGVYGFQKRMRLVLHRGSLSSSLRWGQIRWRFLESRRILAAV